MDTAWDIALRLLSQREHSALEIKRKLAKRGVNSSEIEDVVVRLCESDCLNETRYAEAYCRSRIAKGYGPLHIKFELNKRGICEKTVVDLMVSGVDWHQIGLDALHKKFGKASGWSSHGYEKIARFLGGRGFESEVICSVLSGFPEVSDS